MEQYHAINHFPLFYIRNYILFFLLMLSNEVVLTTFQFFSFAHLLLKGKLSSHSRETGPYLLINQKALPVLV